MPVQLKDCKNCEKPFDEAYEFCPHCGQKDKDDLTLGLLFYNTISNYFSFDARFFKSFFPLLFKPGYLAEKFIAGKRLLYLHPAQMYLFVAIVFFFLNSFRVNTWSNQFDTEVGKVFNTLKEIDTNTGDRVTDSLNLIALTNRIQQDSIDRIEVKQVLENNKIYTGFSQKQIDSIVASENFRAVDYPFNFTKKIDSLIAKNASNTIIYKEFGLKEEDGKLKKRLYEQGLKFYKQRQAGGIFQTFFDKVPIAMFFILPIFALILKLFFRKSGRYTHHLVFSFYFFSFLFTVFSLILILNRIVEIPDWIDKLIVISTFIYLFIAIKHFYKQGWFKSYLKTSFVTLLFFPVALIAGFIVLGFAVMMF
ncbi:DUF3667 domain-containing protein [Lacinutrix sp. C3R15]|uniref:DUF3667 domain-containing protein n=1 Tax=Flavobacteriaceae TaxID=49546 RepID=UPI001C09EE9A|nr:MULTISPECIES: DUF3667 domain-containing protein [Flavobacteriaceae]MBU2938682.1 DUF3667 domain-containing protein [Lacinutrix sp. C3R15]MDO6621996.1 DUF3667 domain-containing protein [Oceanihabitans sp. 1_MG-2023]